MKKLIEVCFCIMVTLFLSGCGSTVLPKGSQFNSQSKKGVVVFSVSCNVAPGVLTLGVLSSDYMPYQVPVSCRGSSDSLSPPELKVMYLAPGKYHFTGYSEVQGLSIISAPAFKYIYFEVKPGVVSYLGWFVVSGQSVRLADAKKRDIAWFKQLQPNVTAPIEIQTPDFSQDEDPLAKLLRIK